MTFSTPDQEQILNIAISAVDILMTQDMTEADAVIQVLLRYEAALAKYGASESEQHQLMHQLRIELHGYYHDDRQ